MQKFDPDGILQKIRGRRDAEHGIQGELTVSVAIEIDHPRQRFTIQFVNPADFWTFRRRQTGFQIRAGWQTRRHLAPLQQNNQSHGSESGRNDMRCDGRTDHGQV